jgi:hypothetical protein
MLKNKILLITIIIIILLSNFTFSDTLPVQTKTFGVVIYGQLYCYCYTDNVNMDMYNFGDASYYNIENDGLYDIEWNGNINNDDQTIKNINSIINDTL